MKLKWVSVGAGREMTYEVEGLQYVLRTERSNYTLVERAKDTVCRHQTCNTKTDAYQLAEQWLAEAVQSHA